MSRVSLSKAEAEAVARELDKAFRTSGLAGYALRALNRIHAQLKVAPRKLKPIAKANLVQWRQRSSRTLRLTAAGRQLLEGAR